MMSGNMDTVAAATREAAEAIRMLATSAEEMSATVAEIIRNISQSSAVSPQIAEEIQTVGQRFYADIRQQRRHSAKRCRPGRHGQTDQRTGIALQGLTFSCQRAPMRTPAAEPTGHLFRQVWVKESQRPPMDRSGGK
jgi:hypothetical protein